MSGAAALLALLEARGSFARVPEKDWAAAAGLIVKKLLISAGQTVETVSAIRAAVGEEIFETQLKSLTHHQARLLARRLDKSVPELEVSTAGASIAWVRQLLAGTAPEAAIEETPTEPEAEPEAETEAKKDDAWGAAAVSLTDEAASEEAPDKDTSGDTSEDNGTASPPPPAGSYFGRRSFRT